MNKIMAFTYLKFKTTIYLDYSVKAKKIEMQIKVVESQNEIYQKQKLLGEGAFGKAYLVKRKADNELLVIKEMNIDHMSQQERNQTIKEAQILKNLNHPNIVKFVEVYVTKQNKLKIVMEFAECGDLSKAISEKKKNKKFFDQNQILDWFTQICLAIKHVHDRKILHRDIKGQNIFITKANTLKLGDFGIARVLNKTMEKARTVVGTPYYLSPQIIENKPYSFQSDIWSIGVVLYELCALTHPFTATSLQFLALKIVKGSFTPIPNQYSKELRGLVNSMLSLDPNKRPTINQIFKYPIIQDRIKNFLTQTKRDHEFSHTILHNHKVEIFTNKLVQMKDKKDFEKEREKLKNEEEILRQKLEQKRQQQKLKAQQQELRQKQLQKQKQKYLERERLRSVQKQKQKEKEQQSRREMLEKQKQRKQYERKQSMLEEQRRKQEQQRKIQREYEQNCKMAKEIQRRLKEDEQVGRYRKQQADLMYRHNQKQQELKKAQKMRKMQDKELEEQRKKKQLQDFARKQFFENQQIMRRAKQRAQQQQAGYNNYAHEPAQQEKPQERAPHFGNGSRNTADNFHYQQKRNSIPESPYKAQTKPEFNKEYDSGSKNVPAKNYQLSQQAEKKHSSLREQMKKDRQNFMKNKNGQHNQVEVLPEESPKQQLKTIKAAKWQRPNSRGGQSSQEQEVVEQKQTQPTSQNNTESQEQIDRTYQFMDPKVSPQDQQNFNQYLFELENIMQNLNQNIEGIEKNQKRSPSKIEKAQNASNKKIASTDEVKENKSQASQFLSEMPEVDQVIYRDDDQDTFELSLTANFQTDIGKKHELFPQIEASTDLELFSNFSKLETLRMNLEDKFGTDNFVQLYRYLQKEMDENGIQAFTNQQAIVNEASKKFRIGKNLLMESFTLLLTLIHMEEKMMGNH